MMAKKWVRDVKEAEDIFGEAPAEVYVQSGGDMIKVFTSDADFEWRKPWNGISGAPRRKRDMTPEDRVASYRRALESAEAQVSEYHAQIADLRESARWLQKSLIEARMKLQRASAEVARLRKQASLEPAWNAAHAVAYGVWHLARWSWLHGSGSGTDAEVRFSLLELE